MAFWPVGWRTIHLRLEPRLPPRTVMPIQRRWRIMSLSASMPLARIQGHGSREGSKITALTHACCRRLRPLPFGGKGTVINGADRPRRGFDRNGGANPGTVATTCAQQSSGH